MEVHQSYCYSIELAFGHNSECWRVQCALLSLLWHPHQHPTGRKFTLKIFNCSASSRCTMDGLLLVMLSVCICSACMIIWVSDLMFRKQHLHNHFTSCFIAESGSVWFYNGMSTGQQMENEGNVINMADLGTCQSWIATCAVYIIPHAQENSDLPCWKQWPAQTSTLLQYIYSLPHFYSFMSHFKVLILPTILWNVCIYSH